MAHPMADSLCTLRATPPSNAEQLAVSFVMLGLRGPCHDAAQAGEAAAQVVAALTASPSDVALVRAGCVALQQMSDGALAAQTALGLAGALPVLARVLQRYSGDASTVQLAASAVVTLCDNHPANRDAAAACALIALLCRGLAAHSQEEDVRRVVSNAIANATSSHVRNAVAAAAAGGVETLAAIVKTYGAVPPPPRESQKGGTAAAVYMPLLAASNILEETADAPRAAFANAGGLRAVLAALAARPHNGRVQELGVATLCALYAGGARALGAAGEACCLDAIRAVLKAVRFVCAATPETQPAAVLEARHGVIHCSTGLLVRLAGTGTPKPTRNAAVNEGAVAVMLDALRVLDEIGSPAPAVAQTFCVLANVCLGNSAAADDALRRGTLQTVVALMNARRSSVPEQDEGANVISTLATNARGGRDAAAAAGAVPTLLAAMREHPMADGMQSYACMALTNLIWNVDPMVARNAGAGARNSAVAAAAVAAGAIGLLCQVLSAGFESEAGGTAIYALAGLLLRDGADAAMEQRHNDEAVRRGVLRIVRDAKLTLPEGPAGVHCQTMYETLMVSLKQAARDHDARATSCLGTDDCMRCAQQRAAGTLCAFPSCGVRKLPAPVPEVVLKKCAGCGTVRYCGADHQRAHWSAHKAECKDARTRAR